MLNFPFERADRVACKAINWCLRVSFNKHWNFAHNNWNEFLKVIQTPTATLWAHIAETIHTHITLFLLWLSWKSKSVVFIILLMEKHTICFRGKRRRGEGRTFASFPQKEINLLTSFRKTCWNVNFVSFFLVFVFQKKFFLLRLLLTIYLKIDVGRNFSL